MFFSKNKHTFDSDSDGCIKDFPESLVNPLYKPKTLAEMRAEMIHTGINPAPAAMRSPIPVSDGVDPMNSPPIPVTGDRFEHIRQAKAIQRQFSKLESDLKDVVEKVESDEPTPPSPVTD